MEEKKDVMSKELNEKKEEQVINENENKVPLSEWVKILFVNTVVTLSILFLYHMKFATPPVAVVDLKGYLATLESLYLRGAISQTEAKEKLDKAIDVIQKEAKSSIVLSSDVVYGKNDKVKKLELPELPKPQNDKPSNDKDNEPKNN